MIKLLLPLLLLTAPAIAFEEPKSLCTDLLDVMMLSVNEGTIEHKEAWAIYKRCLALEY